MNPDMDDASRMLPGREIGGQSGLARQARAMLALGLPLIGTQIAQIVVSVTDTVMIGWLGTTELAAGTLAFQFYFFIWMFGSGFAFAMVPMIAAARGRNDETAVRRHVRMGLWVLIAYFALALIPLGHARDILVLLGQDEHLSAMAEDYIGIARWALLPGLLLMGLRSFASALERPRIVLMVMLLGAVLNAVFNYALIFGNFGAPRMELQGAALATVLAQLIALSVFAAHAGLARGFRQYRIYQRLWKPDWSAFAEAIRIGWPISMTIIAEVGLFTFSSIMMGWLGEIPLAAHGIALQIASIFFMVPLGLSNAATVRSGLALGRGDLSILHQTARAALLMSVVFALAAAILMWTIPERLIGAFLSEDDMNRAALVETAVPLLWVAAAFQLFDGLQAMGAGLLRGIKDTRTPMILAIVSYWGVGIPMAWYLGIRSGLGGPGVWAGLAGGLALAAILLLARFRTQAENAIARETAAVRS